MDIMISPLGDVMSTLIFAAYAALVLRYGKTYNQPWKLSQAIPLGFIALYFLLDVFGLNQAMMRGGFLRAVLNLFGIFGIAHLLRFDPADLRRRILARFKEWTSM